MTQTLAILLDGYRELNAKKLFWITLSLSVVVMVSFAMLGVGPDGLRFAGMNMSMPGADAAYWYKEIFSYVIGLWVAWGSIALALVSTAGIFPDFMSGGTIDLYFSKPIGRLRLFLTKYATGLLFTVLQVTVFTTAAFLAFGLRGGQWRPSLWLIVPLVLCLYSYLFAIAVLLGVLTRSTITALLVTIVVWLMLFLVHYVEQQLFQATVTQSYLAAELEQQAGDNERTLQNLKQNPSITNAFGLREQRLRDQHDRLLRDAADARQRAVKTREWHRWFYAAATVLPKTGETIDLLKRKLFTESDLEYRSEFDKQRLRGFLAKSDPDMRQRLETAKDAELEATKAARSRSVVSVLGTSLGFEAVVLAAAAWVFCRRDY